MSSFLTCPLKKTQAVDIIKPISNYITNTFSGSVLNENKNVIAEFSQLRGNAVVHSLDKHEISIETLQRYYDQLVAMEGKLPIAEDQIRISFTWYDAFNKGSIFGSTKCSLSCGDYERFCVLFNMAALLSQLASIQNLSTDDGLKTAAKYYQQSAGLFSYLKDNVFPALHTLPTPDFSISCLTALVSIMLAQAQDCFYQKASSDKMKDAVVAKIAMQTSDFYQDANRNAAHYETKGLWEKDWIPVLQAKQSYFAAAAEFHQSKVNEASNKYGERVARLQKAEKLINDGIKNAGNLNIPDLKNLAGHISKNLVQAKKDNEFIYLDKVPAQDQLTPVERATLVKALPMSSPMSSNFQDLFTKLVPMSVHQALSTYNGAKGALINSEVGKLREATHFMNGVLASLNLPAAIEDLSGEKVPQSVLEKSSEIKEKGGLQIIDQMIQNLPDLLERNREVLNEAFRMMSEEEQEDQKMREYFKERWTRTPSAKLTQQLKEEGAKYKSILDNATNADNIVKAKYNEHRRGLDILSKSDEEIANSLPKVGATTSSSGMEAVKELRFHMQQVEQIKRAREELEEEFKSATVDIQSKFLQALAAEGYLDCQKIVDQNIEDVYAGLRTQVEKSIEDQKVLLDKIQAAYNNFAAASNGTGASPRDQMLKDLASAYDAYMELTSNLQEGSKFYNNLTELLLKFQNKVGDLVFARKTEKEDLTKDLQLEAAKGTTASTPSIPVHYQQQPVKPDRPPPPNTQPTPAPRASPQNQPSSNPPQQPQYNPYPTQPTLMPQTGYYVPPGAMPYPSFPFHPNYGEYHINQSQVMPGQYIPPYNPQPPMGYQSYQWQQRPSQQ
ncbi:programmed cell death 6-interacting protein [Hydra vulgaris]|uniref:Programmed cell death 6-interacting protein n=1 Tax=Hydra vulgaris TaxID=6087 RepID=A0ABM4CYZ6_HYDVU